MQPGMAPPSMCMRRIKARLSYALYHAAVYKSSYRKELSQQRSPRKDEAGFQPLVHDCMCFQAYTWPSLDFHHIELTEIMRQSDFTLVKYLQDIREGGETCVVRAPT